MDKRIRIQLCSWNVGEHGPKEDLLPWLGLECDNPPEVVFVGMQEVEQEDEWEEKLMSIFHSKDYVRVKTVNIKWLMLQAFVKRCHLLGVYNIESERTKTGFGGLVPNKGGISIRFDLYGVNFIVVNSHLSAHLERINSRIADYVDIIEDQKFRDPDVDNILDHDYVFWIGDLNFRLDTLDKDEIERKIKNDDLKSLWPYDQLTNSIRDELLFIDFVEGPLTFPPTYKFDSGTDDYDTSEKQRKPAWTDRILWMTHEDSFKGVTLDAKQNFYTSYPQYKSSDHKPISSQFDVVVLDSWKGLPIQFLNIHSWHVGKNSTAAYYVGDIILSGWDWIGLYQEDFKDFNDYKTWVWANASTEKKDREEGLKVTFNGGDLEKHGKYLLGFFSQKKNCLVGYSDIFEIKAASTK